MAKIEVFSNKVEEYDNKNDNKAEYFIQFESLVGTVYTFKLIRII